VGPVLNLVLLSKKFQKNRKKYLIFIDRPEYNISNGKTEIRCYYYLILLAYRNSYISISYYASQRFLGLLYHASPKFLVKG
jgi:hypothetical protein